MSRKTVVLITTFLVVVLALFVSCAENPGTTTMKLILSTVSESKTLLPSDSSVLDVSKYTVSGIGPNGKTFSVDSDTSSLNIDGLTIGEWTVTAKGMNSAGTELVTGSLTFTLTSQATPQTIVLNTLVGTGVFRFTVDWHYCDVPDPKVEAYLLGPDMSGDEYPLDVTQNDEAMTATISESLAAGSYRLKMILLDGDTQVAGLVEAVRISNNTTTEGSHVFHFNEFGPSTLTSLVDATGTPIKGSLALEGSPSSMVAMTDYTCKFSFSEPSKVHSEGLTIEWYYDGNFMKAVELTTEGSSLTFTPKAGVHRIDAVVYNKKLGSTGSAACSFTVEPNGQPGELSLLAEDVGTSLEVTANTLISPLPGDKFLVITPDVNKLYVCSAHSSSISVEKTYNTSQLDFLADVEKMFSDPSSNYVIFTGKFVEGKESIVCMYFDASANTLTEKVRQNNILEVPGFYFGVITGAAFSTATNPGYIYLSDGTSKNDAIIKVQDSAATVIGGAAKSGSAYYSMVDIDISASGSLIARLSKSSTSFVSATIGFDSEGQPSKGYNSEANTTAGKHIRFANNQLVVVANDSSFTTYKVKTQAAYTKHKTYNLPVLDLEADGSNYFYILDQSNRIVSFEASAYEVSQLGSVTLPSKPMSYALSSEYFLVVMENFKLNLYGIIRNET